MRTEEDTDEVGFTLIELLIVIAVLGILAAVVDFALGGVSAQSAVAACNANATTVETAVAAYNAQTGGDLPATTASLTAASSPYLQSFPSSPDYAISIDSGVVMIAAPSTATPVAYGTPNACSGAGLSAGAPTTTTTTTTTPPQPPPPTTTTTTTAPPPASNGVTATASSDDYNDYGGQERITLTNSSSITALTITISVAETTGVTHNSQSNSFPGGDLTEHSRTSGGVISYTFVLKARKSIPAGYSNGTVYAQFNGTGSVHAMSGDTWSVTSTGDGIVSILTGTF